MISETTSPHTPRASGRFCRNYSSMCVTASPRSALFAHPPRRDASTRTQIDLPTSRGSVDALQISDAAFMAQSVLSNSNLSTRSRSTYNSDIRSPSLRQPIHAAEYLCRRLHEIGIRAVHGVPGDHNLFFLDYLEPCGLDWVGNCNELNAGYAADGYARMKGISALVSSFGVGELSALNAIAGAHAEYVPIVHIVGTPSTASQQNGFQVHHTLGNGNPNTFADMSRSISCTVVALDDPAEIPGRIDYAIRQCWVQSRPVYVTLPEDMMQQAVEGKRLQYPLDLSTPQNDPDKEDYVVDVVLRYINASQSPAILVDACAIRHRALLELYELVEKSGLPTFVSPMGKGAVNEALPNYCGVYAGDASDDEIRERIETADLVLSIGALKNDFTTNSFNYRLSELSTIDLQPNNVRVKYSEYPDMRMNGILRKLVDRLQPDLIQVVPGPRPQNIVPPQNEDAPGAITHLWFWKQAARWVQPNDVIVTDTGSANSGVWGCRFPPNVTAINQNLWASAGYATPACQGAALAAQELMGGTRSGSLNSRNGTGSPSVGRKYRTVLFTGDTSFQHTAESLSIMIRKDLHPVIFILCNGERYGSERPDSRHVDVTPWRYKELLSAFGAQKGSYQSCTVSTTNQVQALFADEVFARAEMLQFVEVLFAR